MTDSHPTTTTPSIGGAPPRPGLPDRTPPILRPFQAFAQMESSGGLLLMAAAVAALAWANSPWHAWYTALWHMPVSVGVGDWQLGLPVELWISDGLMAVFFLLVGMEIKREALLGDLANPRQAALPVVAAVGGMAVPALLYVAVDPGSPGWGVPMATDIAFSLGVLALLGPRVPIGLKLFLTTLAIVDDIGAVLVIALFYTGALSWGYLLAGGAVLAGLVTLNRLDVRSPLAYACLGVALWLAFFRSGIHPTVAGVLLAMTIPARARIDADAFVRQGRSILDAFARGGGLGADVDSSLDQQAAVDALEAVCDHVQSPLQQLEHGLHPWVTFVILPLFALANAGVRLVDAGAGLLDATSLGIIAGLVIGKPLGIALFSRLAVRLGWADLPAGVTWRHIGAVGCLAGIGFTMSLFIAHLAFEPTAVASARVGILVASGIAGGLGWALLRSQR